MRCHGKTRAGKTCAITSSSTLTDDKGKLVALPLQRGGDYCALHAKPFQTRPADVDASRAVILVFVDTETTGVDIARDRTALITRGDTGRSCKAPGESAHIASAGLSSSPLSSLRRIAAFQAAAFLLSCVSSR